MFFDTQLTFNTEMAAAPRDAMELLLVVVPTGNEAEPYLLEIANWDDVNERFDGEWRYIDQPYSANDPIAWAREPVLPDEIRALAIEVAKRTAA